MFIPMLSVTLLLEINMPSQAFSYSIFNPNCEFSLERFGPLSHKGTFKCERCLSKGLLSFENHIKPMGYDS